MALNSYRSSCLSLLDAGITSISYHIVKELRLRETDSPAPPLPTQLGWSTGVETLSHPILVKLLFWPWEGSRQADGLVLVLVQLLWRSHGAC